MIARRLSFRPVAAPFIAATLVTTAAFAGEPMTNIAVTGNCSTTAEIVVDGASFSSHDDASIAALGDSVRVDVEEGLDGVSVVTGIEIGASSRNRGFSLVVDGRPQSLTGGTEPGDVARAAYSGLVRGTFTLPAETRLRVHGDSFRLGLGDQVTLDVTLELTGPGGVLFSEAPIFMGFEDVVPAGDYTLEARVNSLIVSNGGGTTGFCAAGWVIQAEAGGPVCNVTQNTNWMTIQEAIDAADTGDEIRLEAGTYHETIDLGPKDLTIIGATGDPADVVIDGGGAGTVVTIAGGQTNATWLRDLTIENGDGFRGGAVLAFDTAPRIDNCVFRNNHAFFGGALSYHGHVWLPTVTRCVFEGNTCPLEPGGDGGAIHLENAVVFVEGSTFRHNEANGGAAIAMGGEQAHLIAEYNVFEENTAAMDGGAILNLSGRMDMNSSLFARNDGNAQSGAAIANFFGGDAVITNCTFADNTGHLVGSLADFESTTLVSNSIFFGNTPAPIDFAPGMTVNHSLVAGGWSGAGTGNIDGDPLFANAAAGDYRLTDGSPALDAGDNGAPRVVYGDLDRAPRIRHCRVDLGAYESDFFADCNGNGIGDACDVAPIVNPAFDQVIGGWDLDFGAGGDIAGLSDGAVTITGPSGATATPSATFISQTIEAATATVTFVLDEYESADDDPGCGTGSTDFPVFMVNGLLFPLNQDGTLAPATDGTDCALAGTITNQDPPAGPVTFVADLETLAGAGPYTVGIGVTSTDSQAGPGIAVFASLTATTDVIDANGDGTPDECACAGDVDANGAVDFDDLLAILFAWGCNGCPEDLSGDGEAGFDDLLLVLFNWGPCA